MRTLAIGPESNRPTWSWVGFNLARELSRYYRVQVSPLEKSVRADFILAIKEPPLRLAKVSWKAGKVIYFPHDFYETAAQVRADPLLDRYAGVVCHSRWLQKFLIDNGVTAPILLLDHDDKYVLREPVPYRESGFVLWIGFSKYVRHLRAWLQKHPLSLPLVVLTDEPDRVRIPGDVTQLKWTPKWQQRLLATAKAALDIKGSKFGQISRPFEKLETFIASGLPTAGNNTRAMVEHFRQRGFELASAADEQRWFSEAYHRETAQLAVQLRQDMALTTIGHKLHRFLEEL